jgi:7-keto-8-aminopelargonate synthetase-like enzyme
VVGHENEAMRLSGHLMENGFFVPAIRYPAVARGKARLRITLSAAHSESQVRALMKTIQTFESK